MRASTNSPITAVAQGSLRRAGADLAAATAERIRAVREARTLGLSHQQIGDELGISEAAVRSLLRHNPGRTS